MQKLKDSIEEDSVHNSSEYSAAREEFKRKAHLLQDDANVSFSNLANITLRYYRRESIHDLNVLPMSGHQPNALLIPDMDGDCEITQNNLSWDHVLLMLEFKKNVSSLGKHNRDSDENASEEDRRQLKRNRVDSTRLTGESKVLSHRTNDTESGTISPSGPSHTIRPPDTDLDPTTPEELELSECASYLMNKCPGRLTAFGAILSYTQMRLTYYSRSAYVISDAFDVVKDPVMLSLLFVLFSKTPLEVLGFRLDLGHCDPSETKAGRRLKLHSIIGGGDNFELTPDTQLTVRECIFEGSGLFGRATSVYEVERPTDCEVDLVVKFSWQPKNRQREDIAIRIARSVDPVHSPEIYGVCIAPEPIVSRDLISNCLIRPSVPSEVRELRVLLMRKYKPVEELDNEQYFKVAQQFVQCK